MAPAMPTYSACEMQVHSLALYVGMAGVLYSQVSTPGSHAEHVGSQ